MSPKSIRRKLSAVCGKPELVRIRRRIRNADVVESFVVGVGRQWLFLHVLDPHMFLDGWVALRLDDIRTVEHRGGEDSFPLRALRHFGESPAAPDGVDLDSTVGLFESLGARHPLVTIHVERRDPEVCYIGRVTRVARRTVRLLEINPDATWDDKPTKWPLRDITRVEVAGRYEQALLAVGGQPGFSGPAT